MEAKKVDIVGAYNVPDKGQCLVTLDKTIKPKQLIEADGQIWKVVSVKENSGTLTMLVKEPEESEVKRNTATEAKKLLESLFNTNSVDGAKDDNPEEKAKKLKEQIIKRLEPLTPQMVKMRDWALAQLSEIDTDEAPAVMVMVMSLPRKSMNIYLEKLEKFLVTSVEKMESEGDLPWANIKAIASSNKDKK